MGQYGHCNQFKGRMDAEKDTDGEIEMNAKRKRKAKDHDPDKLERARREEALDDALKNTFPASDPISTSSRFRETLTQKSPPRECCLAVALGPSGAEELLEAVRASVHAQMPF
jgi:hypothetical protein